MSKTTTRNAAAKRKHDEMSGSPAPPSQQGPRGWQNPANTHSTSPSPVTTLLKFLLTISTLYIIDTDPMLYPGYVSVWLGG